MFKSLFGSTDPSAPSTSPSGGLNLLERLKAGIQKTRAGLLEKIDDAISGRKQIDADVLDELEYALITADTRRKTTAEILEQHPAARGAAPERQFGRAEESDPPVPARNPGAH